MKKDITIVTSLVGAGLEREYLLLRELLMQQGHYVMGNHYTDMNSALHASDIMISLEVVSPRTLNLSRNNWLVPNSEWWNPLNDRFLPFFNKILCKTHDCYDIWSKKVGPEKCIYTGFLTRDIFHPEIPRELKCLHVAGKSEHKNTDAVCRAWRMSNTYLPPSPRPGSFSNGPANPIPIEIEPLPPLTVVSRAPCFRPQRDAAFPHRNVTWIDNATDTEIIHLMNSHQIHVIPSMYEGFGHVIHEGLGCGAIVVTTDAPPMNRILGTAQLIPVASKQPRSLAMLNEVSPQAVNQAIRDLLKVKWGVRAPVIMGAREAFLTDNELFKTVFTDLVNGTA